MAESEGSKNLRKLIKDVDKVLQIAKNIKKDIEEIMPAENLKMTQGKARITKSEIPQLIKNIEANGGDASALRAIMVDVVGDPSTEEISDDELVDYNRSLSTVRQGDGLICAICRKPSPILTNDACDNCFRSWTLDCKAAILKMRSKYGRTNHG